MKNTFKTAGTILGIASAIFIISFMVLAWTGPSANPPGENIPAPLNAGTDTQAKQGALGIGGLLTVDRIQITGGNPGLGKVLTSGEDGLTTWEPFTGGSGVGWAPTDIKLTTNLLRGFNFSDKGYKWLHDWIQENGCAGYYVCDTKDINRAFQVGLNIPPGGIVNLLSTGGGEGSINDCNEWTSVGYPNEAITINSVSSTKIDFKKIDCRNFYITSGYKITCCKY